MNVCERLEFDIEPVWEKQTDETLHSFNWFRKYLTEKMSGGSYRSLVAKENKKKGYKNVLEQWATRNRWAERVNAYAVFMAKTEDQERAKARRDMVERQAKSGLLLQQKGLMAIKNVPDSLSPEVAIRFMEVGARMEKEALGSDVMKVAISGQITESRGPGLDVSKFTREEYEQYKALVKKAGLEDFDF